MMLISDLIKSSIEDKEELIELSKEASDFLLSLENIKRVDRGLLDRGWWYMMAIFYFEGELTNSEYFHVWVIVGDLPSALISEQFVTNWAQAIREYISLADEWISERYNPNEMRLLNITAPHSQENINMLEKRVRIIKNNIMSQYIDEL